MIMEFSLFCTFVFFVFTLLVFLASRLRRTSYSGDSKLPPGPWKLPLIGNMHQLESSAPHKALRDLAKKYGPLMHLQLGEVSTVVISSPEMAKEVMKTHDSNFAHRPHIMASRILSYGSRNIAFSHGDYWRQLRKICAMELLSNRHVVSFSHVRKQEVSCLSKSIARSDGHPINLSENIYSTVYCITSRAAFGKPRDTEQMVPLLRKAMELSSGFNLADYFPSFSFLHAVSGHKTKFEALHKGIDKVLSNIVSDHQLSLGDETNAADSVMDFAHVLLNLKNEDSNSPLTINDIKAVVLDIIAGGSESSAALIDWVMSELLKNPSMMKKAQTEVRKVFDESGDVKENDIEKLEYLHLVIKEALRLHIPGPLLLPRESIETCMVNGYVIPAKTKIIINAWAIARDSEYWVEPEKFNPERFLNSSIQFKGNDFEYTPFGAGRRICPGISFAMASVEYFLAQMLFHFDWKLADEMQPEDMDMSELFGISIWRKQQLRVIPSVYQKSYLMG